MVRAVGVLTMAMGASFAIGGAWISTMMVSSMLASGLFGALVSNPIGFAFWLAQVFVCLGILLLGIVDVRVGIGVWHHREGIVSKWRRLFWVNLLACLVGGLPAAIAFAYLVKSEITGVIWLACLVVLMASGIYMRAQQATALAPPKR
jgi:hypothetical protein